MKVYKAFRNDDIQGFISLYWPEPCDQTKKPLTAGETWENNI